MWKYKYKRYDNLLTTISKTLLFFLNIASRREWDYSSRQT